MEREGCYGLPTFASYFAVQRAFTMSCAPPFLLCEDVGRQFVRLARPAGLPTSLLQESSAVFGGSVDTAKTW